MTEESLAGDNNEAIYVGIIDQFQLVSLLLGGKFRQAAAIWKQPVSAKPFMRLVAKGQGELGGAINEQVATVGSTPYWPVV